MPSEMKYILIDLQAKDEGIATIKINRPEVLNSLNREAMSELSTAIDIVAGIMQLFWLYLWRCTNHTSVRIYSIRQME